MDQCFVIQPFDNDKFDRRYVDVFKPAIEAAGLKAYRVDHDPSVSIPIEDIERGIRECRACLADVTADNPNVWFEVGFAVAFGKPICFVCSDERKSLPFDVQHRRVIFYRSSSSSDFKRLGDSITERLNAIVEIGEVSVAAAALSPATQTEGLLPHEIASLAILMAGSLETEEGLHARVVAKSMEQSGFTDIAAALGIDGIIRKGLAEKNLFVIDEHENYFMYSITPFGVDWIRSNAHALVLRKSVASEP